jgi:hypothetical protein
MFSIKKSALNQIEGGGIPLIGVFHVSVYTDKMLKYIKDYI